MEIFGRIVLKSDPRPPVTDKKPFWDVDEINGFVDVRAKDNLVYKVWNKGNVKEVADKLADVRKAINCLLIYLLQNPEKWIHHKIAQGIILTFDIHIPCWRDNYQKLRYMKNCKEINNLLNTTCSQMGKLFEYQEMTPNDQGILGLNKPKETEFVPVTLHPGKTINYEIAKKRKILLKLRNQKDWKMCSETTIMDLAIHELTHTTCNDVRWVDEKHGGNHRKPYQCWHTMMRKWGREIGINLS